VEKPSPTDNAIELTRPPAYWRGVWAASCSICGLRPARHPRSATAASCSTSTTWPLVIGCENIG
jgi:hypothetical protein